MHLTVKMVPDCEPNPEGVILEKSPTFEMPFLLSGEAWQKLQSLRSILETSENGQFCLKEGDWQLDKSIVIHVSPCRNQLQLRSANKSMILDLEDYKYLVLHADVHKEVLLGIHVLKDMIKCHIKDLRENQPFVHYDTVHETMRAPRLFAEEHFSSAIPPATKFIKTLAEEADRNSFTLKQPHDTYRAVLKNHLNTVKEDILNSYSQFHLGYF